MHYNFVKASPIIQCPVGYMLQWQHHGLNDAVACAAGCIHNCISQIPSLGNAPHLESCWLSVGNHMKRPDQDLGTGTGESPSEECISCFAKKSFQAQMNSVLLAVIWASVVQPVTSLDLPQRNRYHESIVHCTHTHKVKTTTSGNELQNNGDCINIGKKNGLLVFLPQKSYWATFV